MRLFFPCSYVRPVRRVLLLIFLLSAALIVKAQNPPAPTITGATPTTVCQGASVTITGTNFDNVTSVKLGNLDAAGFTVVNPTTITATVDEQATGSTITVITAGGTATTSIVINPTPKPKLTDESTLDGQFTNCDNNQTFLLKVGNGSVTQGTGNVYKINWGDNTPAFTQTDWPAGAQTSHTYNAQGYFTLVLTITPPNGCTKSVTYQFYNGQNPLASFTTTSSTTGLCAPATVEFQIGNWFNNSPGTSYVVDFGDGSPNVTLPHPLNATNTTFLLQHTYTKSSCPAADFTATLKATNGCFTTTYTLNQIIIRTKPTADFSTLPAAPCEKVPVCFTNQTINGYSGNTCNQNSSFTWDFGDGTTSTLKDPPCHTYTAAGTYTVTLTASNAACGMDTKTKQVTVSPVSPPPAVVTPVVYCQGQPAVPLSATGTGLLWYTSATGGTGAVTAPTPSTNTPGTRTYYVSQTIPGHCESNRIPITVTINAQPPAPGVTTPVQLCINQPATPLTANGSGLLWYTNPTGGTGSATAPTPATTTLGTTSYYVSQTVNGCEGPRAKIDVTVNPLAVPPAVISPVTYCQNQPAIPLTATGTNLLWYTTATGGVGSSVAPTPSTGIPGNTNYFVSQVTGCGESSRTGITVTVVAGASATISYTPAVLCNTANTATTPNLPVQVTQTGSTGGTYSITPASGLPINAATGEIDPANAAAGVYTIRYTIPGTAPCPDYVTTTTVTVNSAPAAGISYPAICTADAVTPVQLTGTAGGTYSSTAGLTINPATGTITPASSQPGTYTVTYTIAAAGPCPGFTTSTGVTITQAPFAAISYQPAVVCNITHSVATPNPPVPVIRSGTPGGTFSITPASGLPINATTGEINPSGATAGTYTVHYTAPGTGGCANYSATATVTVNSAPAATISYNGTPYCGSINTPQPVSLSGTAGGTFSSTAGLTINPATGAITPASSQPGVYTVTYAIAAAGPCPGYSTTASVTITESPVLSFPVTTQAICSGGTAVFTPSSTVANTTYTWAVAGPLPPGVSGTANGTSSGPNPSISLSFTNTGTISRQLTVAVIPTNPSPAPCAGAAYNLTLTVRPVVPPPVTDTADFCMHTPPAALQVTPLPGASIKWYDKNGGTLNAAPVINTTTPALFTYYVSQVDANGCESSRAPVIAVVHPTAKIISATYNNPTACGIPSGSIVLDVQDLNNNPLPNTGVIVHYNKFQLPATFTGSTNATGKITIPLTAGTYSNFTVETSGSCTSQAIPDVFILKDPSPPAQPLAGYNPPVCTGTPLALTALSATGNQAGAVRYVWAGPAFGPYADTVNNTVITFPAAAITDAGTYVVYAIQNNCISSPASFEVAIRQAPAPPVIITNTPLCEGDALSLQAYSSIPSNGTLNYLWKGPGAGFPVNTTTAGISHVKISDAGIYSVTVSSPETGCSTTTDTLIEIGGYPNVQFAQDTVTLPTGYRLPLAPEITNAADPGILPVQSYTWTPTQDLDCNDALCASPIANIKKDICYNVTVTNKYGCTGSAAMCVKVFCESSQVFIPNAFAPLGNVPENRILMVRATGINTVKSFRVFNRWGRIVFERSNFTPNSPDAGWDGRVNGRLADTGVYIYTVEVICENGVPYTFKGNVTLL